MVPRRGRFESGVHLGVLAIVFLLLFLNVLSNWVIYRGREARRSSRIADMQLAGLTVARSVPDSFDMANWDAARHELIREFHLSGAVLIPSQPDGPDRASQFQWFTSVAAKLPSDQIPELAGKLITGQYQTLARGKENEYFYVLPVAIGGSRNLLVLSCNDPELAFLDDSHWIVFLVSLGVLILIGLLYRPLARFIMSPWRKLRQEAADAGREVDSGSDEVEAVVEEYRQIISELKNKEQLLLALNREVTDRATSLEMYNELLLKSIGSGIVSIDAHGKVVTLNPAAEKILGVDGGRATGENYSTAFDTGEQLSDLVNTALDERMDLPFTEISLALSNGGLKEIGVLVSIVEGSRGERLGVSVLLNDLTEINLLRRELESRQRLTELGAMSAGLAHQLRNSLGAVSGYLTLLKKRLDREQLDFGAIGELTEETATARALVDRFLDFARPLHLEMEKHHLKRLVDDVVSSLWVRPELGNRRIEVRGEFETSVSCDRLLLGQALTNIIENALLACNAGGQVVVDLASTDNEYRIEIRDDGCGMKPEQIEHIFTPFYSTRPSGTGLGLPLAARIIDMHRGRVEVCSTPDTGSTFTVILPVAESQAVHGGVTSADRTTA